MDYSPPSFSVRGILQARIPEWVAIPSPGDLPNPRIEPESPALQADSLPTEPPEKPFCALSDYNMLAGLGGPTIHGVRPWVPALSGSQARSNLDGFLFGKGGCTDPLGSKINPTPLGLPADPGKTAFFVQGLSVPRK